MSNYYNIRLTLTGDPLDMATFALKVSGREPILFKCQNTPPPTTQPLAFSCLIYPPMAIRGPAKLKWMVYAWGCTSYAFDVQREYFNDSVVYTFKVFGGPPQVWALRASREYPRIVFSMEYDYSQYTGGPAGRMVYRDGRYLEVLVEHQMKSGGRRKVIRALRFGADVERVGILDQINKEANNA